MTREEAIAIARLAAAAQPEGYMNPANAHVFEPHEWVVTAIIDAHNAGIPAPVAPSSMRDAVLGMRDTFLQLVAAYNSVHAFEEARDAQVMAIALHKFEDDHNITCMAWPLQPVVGEDGPGLMDTDGRVMYKEDL